MRARVRKHAVLSDRPFDDPARCRECGGVCCRSFVALPLTFAEYEALEALGACRLQLSLRGPHWLVIDGGCEFLADGRCSIYERRPDVCRRFVCEDAAEVEGPRPGATATHG